MSINDTVKQQLGIFPISDVFEAGKHTIQDLYVHCSKGSYDWINCEDYLEELATEKGGCTTFNGPHSRKSLTAFGAGWTQGYTLILDINDEDMFYHVANGRGVLMAVHDPRDYPDLNKNSFYAGPGMVTQVKVQRITSAKLGTPYSEEDCTTEDTLDEDHAFLLEHLKEYQYPYSQNLCYYDCFLHNITFSNCNLLSNKSKRLCTYADMAIDQDSKIVKYGRGELTLKQECAHCPKLCTTTTHKLTLSMAKYPDDIALANLMMWWRPEYNRSQIDDNILQVSNKRENKGFTMHTLVKLSYQSFTLTKYTMERKSRGENTQKFQEYLFSPQYTRGQSSVQNIEKCNNSTVSPVFCHNNS